MTTIVIPTKDRSELLNRCLLSIYLQTSRPRRIVIYDGSKGHIQESMITLLRHAGVEVVVKFTEASLAECRHQSLYEDDYILSVDDDCVLEQGLLERVTPQGSFVVPWLREIDLLDPTRFWGPTEPIYQEGILYTSLSISKEKLPKERVPVRIADTMTILVKTRDFLDCGGFEGLEDFLEFMWMSDRLYKAGYVGYFEPRTASYHLPSGYRRFSYKPVLLLPSWVSEETRSRLFPEGVL